MLIVNLEDLKSLCNTISVAVDSQDSAIEFKVVNQMLCVNYANSDTYVQARVDVDEDNDFYAVVRAGLFLNLVSSITTDTIELTTTNNVLVVKANGVYKIPCLTGVDFSPITVNNVKASFTVSSNILNSILVYNTKQLTLNKGVKPSIMSYYYVDEQGALTFNSGACVNNFTLPTSVKFLLNSKLVKLFKLFKNEDVNFTVGVDADENGINQYKVKFGTDSITVAAVVLYGEGISVDNVPVEKIRARATTTYSYDATVIKGLFTASLNRMKLFAQSQNNKSYALFKFTRDMVTVTDISGENHESVYYQSSSGNIDNEYVMCVDLNDIITVIETLDGANVNIKFGDNQAAVVSCDDSVSFVVPQVKYNYGNQ